MIPLGLLAAAGTYAYRQYDQMRSRVGGDDRPGFREDLGRCVDACSMPTAT